MGQHLLLTDQGNPATVTGVMKDMPENTELKEDMLVAMYSGAGDSSRDQNWGGFGDFSYFLLKPNTNAHALEKKFPAFLENHVGKMMKEDNQTYVYRLEPLKDVYLKTTYQMKLVAGRAFSRAFGADTTQAMIINEAAVRMLGYHSPQDAIGRDFSQWGRKGKIIGVVNDFHYQSLQQVIRPFSMRIEPDGCDQISVKVSPTDLKRTIAGIEQSWQAIIPYRPFSYFFVDEMFDRQYRTEDRFGRLFQYFAALAIFISCLGLLGLASYSTLQRTKEIGVRKVLGASVSGIVGLLSKEFLLLVGIAFVAATPVSFFLMKRWVDGFAYRIDIFSAWWIFAAGGLAAVVIAMLTISLQSIRAALANPVKSLRSE
jgi:putative ABC transport system permease protein